MQTAPAQTAPAPQHGKTRIARTRTSGIWVAVIVAVLVLVFLLIFILQNLAGAQVFFLGASGTLPLGVAMLLAAVAGALLIALVGSARIFQLRHTARRRRH
ncbi:lipopolysaccharide assembly protein LapA domain-containing protein [Amycolatopsis acidiphila]|nr:lipopolysaccharide assembly protein LapA domain-containing protein [Amycolatopsis acidiphila]